MRNLIRALSALTVVILTGSGCSAPSEAERAIQSQSICEGGCAFQNGPNASVQSSYWEIEGLGCVGTAGCFAKLALFENGTGEIRWDGNRSAHCSAGPNLLAARFSYSLLNNGTEIVFASGGVPVRCSSEAQPSETIQSIGAVVADENNFSGEYVLDTGTTGYDGIRVLGGF